MNAFLGLLRDCGLVTTLKCWFIPQVKYCGQEKFWSQEIHRNDRVCALQEVRAILTPDATQDLLPAHQLNTTHKLTDFTFQHISAPSPTQGFKICLLPVVLFFPCCFLVIPAGRYEVGAGLGTRGHVYS
eukprot:g48978.t1